jgi:hypothetical protein
VANRILSQLWLQEERPSDAQRFLTRLEAVDPYLALTLVEGRTADDRAFTLDLLDYRHVAQTELASAQPDWLTEIGIVTGAEPANTAAIFTEDMPATPAFAGDLSDLADWMPPEDESILTGPAVASSQRYWPPNTWCTPST